MDLETIEFSIVDPPLVERKELLKWSWKKAFPFLFLLVTYLVFPFIHPMLFIIAICGYVAWVLGMIIYLELKPPKYPITGHLTISGEGFRIHDKSEVFVPLDQIKFIRYEYDRPQDNTSKSPVAATYCLKLLLKDGTRIKTFVYYKPLNKTIGNYKNFHQLMEYLQKKNFYFYQNIQYVE